MTPSFSPFRQVCVLLLLFVTSAQDIASKPLISTGLDAESLVATARHKPNRKKTVKSASHLSPSSEKEHDTTSSRSTHAPERKMQSIEKGKVHDKHLKTSKHLLRKENQKLAEPPHSDVKTPASGDGATGNHQAAKVDLEEKHALDEHEKTDAKSVATGDKANASPHDAQEAPTGGEDEAITKKTDETSSEQTAADGNAATASEAPPQDDETDKHIQKHEGGSGGESNKKGTVGDKKAGNAAKAPEVTPPGDETKTRNQKSEGGSGDEPDKKDTSDDAKASNAAKAPEASPPGDETETRDQKSEGGSADEPNKKDTGTDAESKDERADEPGAKATGSDRRAKDQSAKDGDEEEKGDQKNEGKHGGQDGGEDRNSKQSGVESAITKKVKEVDKEKFEDAPPSTAYEPDDDGDLRTGDTGGAKSSDAVNIAVAADTDGKASIGLENVGLDKPPASVAVDEGDHWNGKVTIGMNDHE